MTQSKYTAEPMTADELLEHETFASLSAELAEKNAKEVKLKDADWLLQQSIANSLVAIAGQLRRIADK